MKKKPRPFGQILADGLGASITSAREGVFNPRDKKQPARRPRPSEFREHLRRRFSASLALVEEYIRDAEDQDGSAYWQNFNALQDADDDFKRYRDNSKSDDKEDVDPATVPTTAIEEAVSNLVAEHGNVAVLQVLADHYRHYAEDPIMPPPRAVRANAQSIVLMLSSRELRTCAQVLDKDMDNGFPDEEN